MSGPRARPPAAAGTFYPSDAAELAGTVDRLLDQASVSDDGPPPLGLIVPHAGYRYSGPVAASAYSLLRSTAMVQRWILVGPAHFVPMVGCAVTGSDAWRTPLGDIEVDEELRRAALEAGATATDEPHAQEHSLEVQLPFLQRLGRAHPTILPIVVGGGLAPDGTADLIEALGAGTAGTLLVVSTDLSHYVDVREARRRDRRTADAVLARDADAIRTEDACGSHALRGLLVWARRHSSEVRLLDLRNSADTAGDPHRVVGYGAFAIA